MQANLLDFLQREEVLALLFGRTHCGTCGKEGSELNDFNTCIVCGAAWCDRCAPACSHSTEE